MQSFFSPKSTLGRAAVISVAVTILSGFKLVTNQELEKIRAGDQGPVIDPVQTFEDISQWADNKAAPLDQVMQAIDSDGFDAACKQYGIQESQAFPCTFWVKYDGNVSKVDTSSRVGRMTLAQTGDKQVNVLIGPVIPGTAVRDGYPEISYDAFGSQDSFAAFSDELNRQVESLVKSKGMVSNGQHLIVVGAYATWDGMDNQIDIVPVRLDTSEGQ